MKQNTGRKLLSVLLTLGLVLGLIPGMNLTAYAATNYDLWIGGTQVTSDNLSGTGWSYDAGTKTLTLDGYSNNGAGYSWTDNGVNFAPIYAKQDLTLLLKGSNSITGPTGPQTPADFIYPICIDGNLSIAGNGMLNANGSDTKVFIKCGDITIKGGTVYANAIDYGIWCNNITIEGGTVNLTVTDDGSRGIWANNDVTIKSGSVTTKSTYDSGALSDGILGKKITIEGGTIVASSVNGNGISAGNDMTIKGGNVTATGSSYGIRSEEGLTIEGGTVIAVGNNECGIAGINGVTISDGTVTASGNAGIWGYMDITISGGDVTASGTTTGLLSTVGYYIIGDGLEAKAGTSAADAEYLNITPLEQHESCDELKSYFNLSSDTHWNYLDTDSLSGKQWARVASHIHNFTFSASGDTVTGICSASGCELPLVDGKRTATLTIKVPTTDDGKAVLEGNPASAIGDLYGSVTYQTKTGSTWGAETTTAPTTDGIHRAILTVGNVTASVSYGMNCITYATGLSNGSISGSTRATCDATITPTIEPAAGYQLDTLTVTPEAGSGISTVAVNGSTFVMPEANVTVSATFKKITYTVTVDGGIATVTDSTPEQNTYTAELTGLPSDKDYDGNMIALSATVQKSEGFPSQVAVGNVSFKFGDTPVDYAFNAGTYTATATVGDKTISKSFRIRGLEPITYEKTTKVGNSYLTEKIITDQYVLLKDNPSDITILTEGITYVAKGNIVVGALVYKGDVRLIECEGSHITTLVGIYHIGSTLELYAEEGAKNSVLEVEGSKALTELDNTTGYTLEQIEGKGSSLSGNIYVYGGKLISAKGGNANLFADDIRLTIGAGLCAKGSTDVSEPAYFTGGYENSDGSVTYNKASLAGLTSVFIEKKTSATMTTVPVAKALIYNGTAQELVTAGEATGGTMYYAVTTENTAPTDDNLYTTSIPTKTDVGTYYVYYKAIGDSNHTDSQEYTVEVTINKAVPDYKVPENLTAQCGTNVSDIELPERFAWDTPDEPIKNIGDNEFTVTFTPSDTDNYLIVNDIIVKVKGIGIHHAEISATCEDDGVVEYWEDGLGNKFSDENGTNALTNEQTVIEKLNHKFINFLKWVWNGFKNAVIWLTCDNNRDHIMTIDVPSKVDTVDTPDCTHEGYRYHVATYDVAGKTYTTVNVETLNQLGHDWYPVYDWDYDGFDDGVTVPDYYLKATLICNNDEDHQVKLDVKMERIDNEDGSVTFIGHCEYDGVDYTDSITVKVEPATPDTPATPDEPTPATPDEPTPATPDEPTPTTPDEPTPATPDEPTPTTPDEPEPAKEIKGILGDVNNDGQVDSADALLILRNSVGLETFDETQNFLGDVNEDNENIDSSDALAVLRYSIGIIDIEKIGTPVSKTVA